MMVVVIFCVYFILNLLNFQEVIALDPKIVGGSLAEIKQFPYQVSINYKNNHICGGAIIGPYTVITAAHCLTGAETRYLKIFQGSELYNGGTMHLVSEFYVNEFYNEATSNNDIALIKVKKQFPLKNAISLPEQDEVIPKNVIGAVAGWGYSQENDGVTRKKLRKIFIPVISQERCENLYAHMRKVTDGMFCAGIVSGGKDACQGDSGGPFVAQGKVIGVVSWGYGCARPGYPGVYTKISKFRTWINKYNT